MSFDKIPQEHNPEGTLYLHGDHKTENSVRLTTDSSTGKAKLKRLVSNIWQPSTLDLGPGSLGLGLNLAMSAAGNHLSAVMPDGHVHLFAHSVMMDGVSVSDTKMLYASNRSVRRVYQSDSSSPWSGTTLEYDYIATEDILVDQIYIKTGTTAATEPVRIQVWVGTDDTGIPIFDQVYEAALFPASSEVALLSDGCIEYVTDTAYFIRWSSDATFSTLLDTTGEVPWLAADVSDIGHDNLLQTAPWIGGATWAVGDTFIDDRKIYTCNVDGVQTGEFADNIEKWNEHGQWLRLGTAISYDAGHVEVGGGDVIITAGVIRSDGKNSMGDAFIAGLSAGAALVNGHGNTLIGYKAGNLLVDETENTFVGMKAGEGSTDMQHTTGIGAWCLQNALNVDRGTAIGGWAGEDSSADDCVYLGYKAGFGETTPSKLWITNNDGPLIEGSFADEWLHIYGELTVDQDLVIGEEGVYDGKITLEDSGSKSDHATLYTNSDGDLIMEAVANGAIIENVIDGFAGWFVVSDQDVSGLMTVKHTTGDMAVKGNTQIGGAGYPDRLSVRSPLGNGYLIPALRLINPYHTAGTATGLLFQLNSSTPGYARAGIFFEANGVGWGRGTMHFATKATAQTNDVDISNSVMKIDELGRVGIGLGADAPVAKLDVNGNVHISGDLHFKGSGQGLHTASMFGKDNTTPMILNSAAKVQVTAFDTNGHSVGDDTAVHGQDEIIVSGGAYFIVASMHVNNNAAQSHTIDVSVWINDGATELPGLHGHRSLTGGSGDVAAIPLSGVAVLTNGDTVEVWIDTSDAGDRSITVEDISLTLIRIGA